MGEGDIFIATTSSSPRRVLLKGEAPQGYSPPLLGRTFLPPKGHSHESALSLTLNTAFQAPLPLTSPYMPAGSRWTPASSPRMPPPVPPLHPPDLLPHACRESLDPRFQPSDAPTGASGSASASARHKGGSGLSVAAVRSGPADRNYAFLYDDVIPEERKGLKDRLKVRGGGASSSLHTPHVPSWYRECATGRNLVRTLNDEEGMREQFCFCRLPPPGRYLCIRGGCHGMHARCSRCGC